MENELKIKMYSFNLDCKAPNELAGLCGCSSGNQVIDENFACVYARTIRDRTPAYCFSVIRSTNLLCGRRI